MNKKGDLFENMGLDTVSFILIVVVFLGLTFWTIISYSDGSPLWEDFYAKEVVRVINSAEPGDKVFLDVSLGATIALDNGVQLSSMFNFDNANNKVIVSLTPKTASSFSYFNDVDVVNWEIESPSGTATSRRLIFEIAEKPEVEDE